MHLREENTLLKRFSIEDYFFSLVNLVAGRDIELIKVKDDPLEVLTVLHSIYEVAADDVFLTMDISLFSFNTLI